ncbi:ABC transporter, ATP-binding protein [Streptococcus sp. DD10]|uniref:ATP-binding cassette domain-containing protein n=1 Tax=Streptococcus sp. DD10 TaxID=1777878 RepID=UPI00079AFB5B|nr:ATP-binding cassette domain-containing protein [Streptococcus sp. DD10]KXT74708.1 ABC transporter, ATP-binding protein [Streptococcus sp. DD10]
MVELVIQDLTSKTFQNLNFELKNPGIYGIIGANGVGKSTLFSLLNREIQFNDGTISSGKLAYIPNLDIFDKHLTANDYFDLLNEGQKTAVQNISDKFGKQDFFDKKISNYSLGMKELFAFIYLLAVDSEIIILDELLDGLDEQKRFIAYQLLKEIAQHKIVLFTSHNLSEVFEISHQVYLLDDSSLKNIADLKTAQKHLSI